MKSKILVFVINFCYIIITLADTNKKEESLITGLKLQTRYTKLTDLYHRCIDDTGCNINESTLKDEINSIGISITDEEAKKLLSRLNYKFEHKISFEQFNTEIYSFVPESQHNFEKNKESSFVMLKGIFMYFSSGNEQITRSKVAELMKLIDEQMNETELDEFMKNLGADKEGPLKYENFVLYFKKP
ncbi:uncharacterized protein LOC126898851 [Daktulosphaira vitifoliae]|uniref:uncharacterized protein LOC126898851 n=1 Tax=Daktulosphaira vitifoliae TaxID=58002 RepID=UPI0021AA58F4|nr:uncharacterized protein LOC126898851 [Daktulosphaira vitifoliae]